MSIFIFFVVLGVLILSHEFGHFLVAKRAGIRVDEFGIGFPPRLVSWRHKETTYSINWLPFGGFVKIFGEDAAVGDLTGPDRERSLASKPRRVQALVLVAGVVFNLFLAWILIASGYFFFGLPTTPDQVPTGYTLSAPAPTILSILPNSPAAEAKLKAGDRLLKLQSGTKVLNEPTVDQVLVFIKDPDVGRIELTYTRAGQVATTAIQPVAGLLKDVRQRAIGVAMETVGVLRLPFHRAVIDGARATVAMTIATAEGFFTLIKSLFQSDSNVFQAVTGPVGLVTLVGDATHLGFGYLFLLTALISINLAVLNLIPFPALDGGRLLFLLIEWLKGSRIKPEIANLVNIIGFSALIIFMLAVTYADIARLIT